MFAPLRYCVPQIEYQPESLRCCPMVSEVSGVTATELAPVAGGERGAETHSRPFSARPFASHASVSRSQTAKRPARPERLTEGAVSHSIVGVLPSISRKFRRTNSVGVSEPSPVALIPA